MYCLSLTAYTYLPTSSSGYFSPLIYFRNSRLVCLLFHCHILNLLSSPSVSCITLITALAVLPTAIAFLSFFAMDGVTRHIFKVWLLVPCQPVLFESCKVISGVIWCDKIRNGMWSGGATAFLNSVFLCIVDFVLVSFVLLT